MCDSSTSDDGGGPERRRPVDQGGVPVGQHQVGGEGEPGQPGPERGGGAEGAGHDLAVAAEHLGAGDRAVLGPGHPGRRRVSVMRLLAAHGRGPLVRGRPVAAW